MVSLMAGTAGGQLAAVAAAPTGVQQLATLPMASVAPCGGAGRPLPNIALATAGGGVVAPLITLPLASTVSGGLQLPITAAAPLGERIAQPAAPVLAALQLPSSVPSGIPKLIPPPVMSFLGGPEQPVQAAVVHANLQPLAPASDQQLAVVSSSTGLGVSAVNQRGGELTSAPCQLLTSSGAAEKVAVSLTSPSLSAAATVTSATSQVAETSCLMSAVIGAPDPAVRESGAMKRQGSAKVSPLSVDGPALSPGMCHHNDQFIVLYGSRQFYK